jgi:hypothetical protein
MVSTMVVALVLATPVWAQGRGGGGGGKNEGPVYARQVSIDDAASPQLKSDRLERAANGDLIEAIAGVPVFYTDHRIVHVDESMVPVAPFADPCVGVGLNDAQFDFDRGADPYETGCNAAFPSDGRTFTIELRPADPGDYPNDPVHVACAQFSFLIESTPVAVWGSGYPSEWQTGFSWIDSNDPAQGCTVTPSVGGIITDPDSSQVTANAQFYADPFATVKIKGKSSDVEQTGLNINFRIDRQVPGAANQWQIRSQDADLPVTKDPANDNVRTISADQQLFDLCLAGGGCVAIGFKLPLQIRYERVEVAQ